MDENKECCCSRTKVRSDAEYRDLITRLNRIEGQIRGIRGMVEKDAYCIDILGQVSAVNGLEQLYQDPAFQSYPHLCGGRCAGRQ